MLPRSAACVLSYFGRYWEEADIVGEREVRSVYLECWVGDSLRILVTEWSRIERFLDCSIDIPVLTNGSLLLCCVGKRSRRSFALCCAFGRALVGWCGHWNGAMVEWTPEMHFPSPVSRICLQKKVMLQPKKALPVLLRWYFDTFLCGYIFVLWCCAGS